MSDLINNEVRITVIDDLELNDNRGAILIQ